ncbi:MAG: hypothetical protein CM1200mP3_08010 [Chloroflexota bacterium]|nr:MAG: hypothetical protein CM1200mP3_08010 [Chloroflexota bacterium]
MWFLELWVASICFILAQLGFIWYVGKFPVYNILYGAVGAIMALLAWVYISALIILFRSPNNLHVSRI